MNQLADKLTKLIRDELAKTQVNKDNESKEYRTGKMEGYCKILSVITEDIKSKITSKNSPPISEWTMHTKYDKK